MAERDCRKKMKKPFRYYLKDMFYLNDQEMILFSMSIIRLCQALIEYELDINVA